MTDTKYTTKEIEKKVNYFMNENNLDNLIYQDISTYSFNNQVDLGEFQNNYVDVEDLEHIDTLQYLDLKNLSFVFEVESPYFDDKKYFLPKRLENVLLNKAEEITKCDVQEL